MGRQGRRAPLTPPGGVMFWGGSRHFQGGVGFARHVPAPKTNLGGNTWGVPAIDIPKSPEYNQDWQKETWIPQLGKTMGHSSSGSPTAPGHRGRAAGAQRAHPPAGPGHHPHPRCPPSCRPPPERWERSCDSAVAYCTSPVWSCPQLVHPPLGIWSLQVSRGRVWCGAIMIHLAPVCPTLGGLLDG